MNGSYLAFGGNVVGVCVISEYVNTSSEYMAFCGPKSIINPRHCCVGGLDKKDIQSNCCPGVVQYVE